MFIHKSHVFFYVLAGNQCRGLGVVARPAWSPPVLHKVFVFVSPKMRLSVHPLPPLQLHPGTVLYPVVFPALSPSASPAAPKRRKGLSSPELTMALPVLTASASHQEHTAQVRLSQLHRIFRSCGIKTCKPLQELQGKAEGMLSCHFQKGDPFKQRVNFQAGLCFISIIMY